MNNKKYLLVVKRGNNDYMPIDWHILKSYNNENLNTIEGIDTFTTKHDKLSLINELIDNNILSLDDYFQEFAIIYPEKGKNRLVKEGVLFKDKKEYLNINNIISIIINNINDKQFINNLSNLCKDENIKVQEFKYILKNIDIFKEKGINAIIAAISKFEEIPYEIRRKLSFNIIDKLTNR